MANTVYVDFNNMDSLGRIRLNSTGTVDDIRKLSLQLEEGMVLVVSDCELESKGVVEFSGEENIWVVRIE